MPVRRRLLQPVREAALSPQGIGTSTAPWRRPRGPFPALASGGWQVGVVRSTSGATAPEAEPGPSLRLPA